VERDSPNIARLGGFVFATLVAVSLLFFSGRLETSDEVLMAATSHAIAGRFGLTHGEIYGQTFSGYGVGTPLVGVPFAWLERGVRAAGLEGDWSLLPLANAVLFGLIGVFAFGIARRLLPEFDANRLARCSTAVLLASPLLPASATFYSEVLSAAALLGVAWAVGETRATKAALAAAFLCGAFGVMARVAMGPFLGLAILWGWRRGTPKPIIAASIVGVATGVAVWMGVNTALRGGPFATGYRGQDFTTPLLTGLHGLLVSPERGLLIFFPAIALLLSAGLGVAWESFRRLAMACLLFSLAFHAKFWTWHGGWTTGPRFLLPAMALAMPLVAGLLCAPRTGRQRALALGAMLWGCWGAVRYAIGSTNAWWNEVWGFHQVESRWLFEPQLSLWSADFVNAKPLLLRAVAAEWPSCWLLVPFGAMAAGVAWLTAAVHGRDARATKVVPVAVGAAAVAFFLVHATLDFGWQATRTDGTEARIDRLKLTQGSDVASASALLDLTDGGDYTFHLKGRGKYRIEIDGRAVAENAEDTPIHLREFKFHADGPGTHLMEVEFEPFAEGDSLLSLFWTWPGEGRVLEPVAGPYVLASEPGAAGRVLLLLWRRGEILLAGVMALVLLWEGRRAK